MIISYIKNSIIATLYGNFSAVIISGDIKKVY